MTCLLAALAMSAAAMSGKIDRKSTRLNSSHLVISYAVFCLKILEDSATLLVVFELVVAGAGRRQQYHVTRTRSSDSGAHCVFQRFAGVEGDDAAQLRLDFGSCGADGVHRTHALPQEWGEQRVVRAFV